MNHFSTDDLIQLLTPGEIPLPGREEHLRTCSHCRRELEILRKIEKMAGRSGLDEPSTGFSRQVIDRTRTIRAFWIVKAWLKKHQQWVWGCLGLAMVFLSQFSRKSGSSSIFDLIQPETQKYGETLLRNFDSFLRGIRETVPFLFENGNPLIFFSVGITIGFLYLVDRFIKQALYRKTI